MAKLITYLVSFSPAQKTAHGFTSTISLLTGNKDHEVTAASLPDLEREVRRMAREFGQSCTPYIRLKDRKGRKPAGFDAWCYGPAVRFIEFVPAPALNMARGQMMMDKADALRRQAEQVAHYGRTRPWLAALVAAATTADALADGEHTVVEINRHIPRGGDIEAMIAKHEATQ